MANTIRVFVGTYTGGKSEGIYVYDLNGATGALTYSSHISGIDNPSFLALSPTHSHLYAVSETGDPGGKVFSYAIDPDSGALTYLNDQRSHGTLPCSIDVDKTGQCVLVANYGSGTISSYPIQKDGTLGKAVSKIQHEGSSVIESRQRGPHAHMIRHDLDDKYVFVPDLGMDKIMIYTLDPSTATLTAHGEGSVPPGSGPRHIDFHPNRKYAYVINEISSTITAFQYDASAGTLTEIETVTTLPDHYEGTSHTADIHITDSGKYIYGSNRGHDSLAMYEIDESTGRLTMIGIELTRGENPRNFGIDPTNTFVLVGNQSTDTVTTFRLDHETGKLIDIGQVNEVPAAVCLKMVVVD